MENKYAQMDKNTVKATNQLKPNQCVTFENLENDGLKIMFVGNSITRHGVLENIGWFWDHGMAASSKDKDYVHQLISKINPIHNDASFCICQVADWERGYKTDKNILEQYQPANDFDADIIVIRFIENCRKPETEEDIRIFDTELEKLLQFLNPSGKAKFVITTGFWHHPLDDSLRKVAKQKNYPLVELGDLGEDDKMKAVGLFEHEGVAAHPGDLGMQTIAERIFEKLKDLI